MVLWSQQFGTITLVERGAVRVNCFVQAHNTRSPTTQELKHVATVCAMSFQRTYYRCDYLPAVDILVVPLRGTPVPLETVPTTVPRCWNMASFCPYVRTFDKLWLCTTGTWDTVLLPGNVVCDAIAKLLLWMTVTVFVAVGRGIATFVCFWSCMFAFAETVAFDVCVVLLDACEASWLAAAAAIATWCWPGM